MSLVQNSWNDTKTTLMFNDYQSKSNYQHESKRLVHRNIYKNVKMLHNMKAKSKVQVFLKFSQVLAKCIYCGKRGRSVLGLLTLAADRTM